MNRFLRLFTFCLTIGISKSGKQITRHTQDVCGLLKSAGK